MSKIILLGDTHFGVRNGNPIYFKYFAKFYKDFFEYIDKNKISTIIQLGDLVDKRKSIDFLSLQTLQNLFLNPCQERNIKLYVISGNHDCYYKSTNEVNSVNLLSTPNMIVVDQHPVTQSLDGGFDFDFYPWINEFNSEECINYIQNSKSKFAVGHFEFANFRLHKHQISDAGMDHKICKNYKLVFSGHYHTISRKDNVLYTGTPYELDWNDWNDSKGFWTLDIATSKLEFIKNEHRLYEKYDYDENDLPDITEANEKFVKLIVKNKTNQYKFDTFLNKLLSLSPYDVQVIDDEISKSIHNSLNLDLEVHTTQDMINKVIDNMDFDLDRNILKKMISDVYTEAVELSKV